MSTATTPSVAPADRADRLAFAAVATLAGALGLLTIADGLWRTIGLAVGSGPVDLVASAEVADNLGWVSQATVVSGDLSEVPRLLLVIGSALSLVVAGAVFAAIIVFLVMIVRGTPFHRRLYPLVLGVGAVMSIGGVLAGGVDGLGRMMAGGELGDPYRAAFELHLGPWAFGFVVIAAAFVLRAGTRLQRDQEGLV